MSHIVVRNVNDAYQRGVELVLRLGNKEHSRNGEVITVQEPVLIEYMNPRERVLFDPSRDANPFFHFMEAIWMLAGEKAAAWPVKFNKQMAEYANDDGEYDGAYGYRWRQHFGFDQITYVVDQLRADPSTRRAVIGMYDPRTEKAGSRDIPCFSGDTPLWSPEGDLPFEEISRKFECGEVTRWPVYAVDPTDWSVKISWADNVWCSGTKKTLRLTFDDGSSLRVTPEHILYRKKNGHSRADKSTPTMAKDLRVGDRMVATHRWYSPKGHEQIKKSLLKNTSFSNTQKTHREYAALIADIPEGHVVHHLNDIKTDNRWENLSVISESDHNRLHRLGDLNPMRRMEKSRKVEKGLKHSKAMLSYWESKRKIDNHVIVGIEQCEEEPVYDFSVPEGHNALVGTGVVAHNCNTQIFFRIVRGRLNMTVTNRSNDAVWGAFGANAVHFSMLQEVIAAMVGVPVGHYFQFTNNLHIYTDIPKVFNSVMRLDYQNYYMTKEVEPYALVQDPTTFLRDCENFVRDPYNVGNSNPMFYFVAHPMYMAWMEYRKGNLEAAANWCRCIEASDWKLACRRWLQRRQK